MSPCHFVFHNDKDMALLNKHAYFTHFRITGKVPVETTPFLVYYYK
jgi:hypothetical protein